MYKVARLTQQWLIKTKDSNTQWVLPFIINLMFNCTKQCGILTNVYRIKGVCLTDVASDVRASMANYLLWYIIHDWSPSWWELKFLSLWVNNIIGRSGNERINRQYCIKGVHFYFDISIRIASHKVDFSLIGKSVKYNENCWLIILPKHLFKMTYSWMLDTV